MSDLEAACFVMESLAASGLLPSGSGSSGLMASGLEASGLVASGLVAILFGCEQCQQKWPP